MENNNQISKLGESTAVELHEIAGSIKNYIETDNDETLQIALERINSKPTFWQRLFPDKFTKQIDAMTMGKIQDINTAKRALMAIHTETQLEITRQQCDALVKATGVHLKQKVSDFASKKLNELQISLKNSNQKFGDDMYEQLKYINKYNDEPDLAQPYKEHLKKQIKEHFLFIDTLLLDFRETLNTKIKG